MASLAVSGVPGRLLSEAPDPSKEEWDILISPRKHNSLKFPLVYMTPDPYDLVRVSGPCTQVHKHTHSTYTLLHTCTLMYHHRHTHN